MLIVVISAGAGPYSLDAVIVDLIDRNVSSAHSSGRVRRQNQCPWSSCLLRVAAALRADFLRSAAVRPV